MLFILNLKKRKEKGPDSAESKNSIGYNYSLEHIMPQEFETYWKLPTKKVDGDSFVNDDEAKSYRATYVGYFGNMTIITPNLNSKIKNFEVDKKMNGDSSHKNKDGTIRKNYKGYVDNCTEEVSNDFIEEIKSKGKWDEAMIEERNSSLETQVLNEWQTTITSVPKEEEANS